MPHLSALKFEKLDKGEIYVNDGKVCATNINMPIRASWRTRIAVSADLHRPMQSDAEGHHVMHFSDLRSADPKIAAIYAWFRQQVEAGAPGFYRECSTLRDRDFERCWAQSILNVGLRLRHDFVGC